MSEKRKIIGNPEDIMSLKVIEINDVYEIGLNEFYYEIMEYDVIQPINQKK